MKKILFLTLFLTVISMTSFGQPGNPGDDGTVPITGLEYLLGGGALLGLKKIVGQIKAKRKE